MIEFWAVIGLACLDHVFLARLMAHEADEEDEEDGHIEATIREYGFRLSRYEMGELKRVMRIPEALHLMHQICTLTWADALGDLGPCDWSAERSAAYDPVPNPHPYVHRLVNLARVERLEGVPQSGMHIGHGQSKKGSKKGR